MDIRIKVGFIQMKPKISKFVFNQKINTFFDNKISFDSKFSLDFSMIKFGVEILRNLKIENILTIYNI